MTTPASESATPRPLTFTAYLHQVNPTPTALEQPPVKKIMPNFTFAMQPYNNCGPASLSMALSHYAIMESQETLADDLRPHRNDFGIDDDKSVTLEELAKKAKALKIEKVVFDRGGYLYAGKIKAVADAMRKGGIIF